MDNLTPEAARRLERAAYAVVAALAFLFLFALVLRCGSQKKVVNFDQTPFAEEIAQSAKNSEKAPVQKFDPDNIDLPEPNEEESEEESIEQTDVADDEVVEDDEGEDDDPYHFEDVDFDPDEIEIPDDEDWEQDAEDSEYDDSDYASEEDEDDGEDEVADVEKKGWPNVVVIPDDVETLAEALDFVAYDGVVILKPRKTPYELGTSRSFDDARFLGAYVTGSVTVRGENPGEVGVRIPGDRRIWIDPQDPDKPVLFENITFYSEKKKGVGPEPRPSVSIIDGTAEFRNCVFCCERNANLCAVLVEPFCANVKCEECKFYNYGDAALRVGDESVAAVTRCLFARRNACGVFVGRNAKFVVSFSEFLQNEVAVCVASGAVGSIDNCKFNKNRQNLELEDDWKNYNVSCVGNDGL